MPIAFNANFSIRTDLTFTYGGGSDTYVIRFVSSTPFSVVKNGQQVDFQYASTDPYSVEMSVAGTDVVSLPGAIHYKDVPLISLVSATSEPALRFRSFNSDETVLYYPDSYVFELPETWASACNVEAAYFPGNPFLRGVPSSWKGLEKCRCVNLSGCVETARGGLDIRLPESWEGLDSLSGQYGFEGSQGGPVILRTSFAGMTYMAGGGTSGLEHLARLEHAAGMFSGCTAWQGDAGALYEYLSTKDVPLLDHEGCFQGCSSAEGMDRVPADWK